MKHWLITSELPKFTQNPPGKPVSIMVCHTLTYQNITQDTSHGINGTFMMRSTDTFWNKKQRTVAGRIPYYHCWLSGWLLVCCSFYSPGSLFYREKNTRNRITVLLCTKMLIQIWNPQWPDGGQNLTGNNSNSENIAQPTLRASRSPRCTGFITQITLLKFSGESSSAPNASFILWHQN